MRVSRNLSHSQVPSVDDCLRDADAEVEPDEVQRGDDDDVPAEDLGADGEHAVAQRVQEPGVKSENRRQSKRVGHRLRESGGVIHAT